MLREFQTFSQINLEPIDVQYHPNTNRDIGPRKEFLDGRLLKYDPPETLHSVLWVDNIIMRAKKHGQFHDMQHGVRDVNRINWKNAI